MSLSTLDKLIQLCPDMTPDEVKLLYARAVSVTDQIAAKSAAMNEHDKAVHLAVTAAENLIALLKSDDCSLTAPSIAAATRVLISCLISIYGADFINIPNPARKDEDE